MLSVIKIHWERANLHLTVDRDIKGDIFLVKGDCELALQTVGREIIVPVYNLPEGESLPAGKWYLSYEDTAITISKDLIYDIENFSRNFLYRKGRYALLINFRIDRELTLYLFSRYMRTNPKPKKFFRLSDERKLRKKLKMILTVAGLKAVAVYYHLLRPLRKSRNVLFLTENSDELRDNLKMVYNHIDTEKYKVRVFAKDTFSGKHRTYFELLKELTYIGLSKVIFVDNYCPLLVHVNLSKNVKLVQLWHAGLGFKSLGYARFGMPGSPHAFRSSHRKYTNVYVDSEKPIDVYKEVFGCKREAIKATGIPRLDGYLDPGKYLAAADRLYKENPLLKTEKTILFAPTFRGKTHKNAYYDFTTLDFDAIYDFLKKNGFVFLIKMHPFVTEVPEIPEEYKDRIFNYGDYNINDLIYISDVMITDYSSCAYEFSMFDRPIVFFRYDKAVYEYERQVYTLDVFSKKQYEVQTSDELLKVLNGIKDSLPADRFAAVKGEDRRDVCKTILADVFGETL